MIDRRRLEQANHVLETFAPNSRFVVSENGRLCIRTQIGEAVVESECVLREERYLLWDHKRHGMTGAGSQATAHLALYIQCGVLPSTRLWEYWTTPNVGLGNSETLRRVRAINLPEADR